MTRDCLTSPPSFISRAPYTLPADAMAPAVDLLVRQPNAMSHALVAGMAERKGRAWARAMLEQMLEEIKK
jgi:hypothetical protein